MKNKYIAGALALLLIIFVAVIGVLPRSGVTIKEQGQSYTSEVFNQNRVTTVDITINEADLAKMLESPLEEKMYAANVTINGVTVENVGLRTKGNMTLRSVAQMEDSDRYSFKIDFDKYVDEQNLHGLKKLNLNNNYTDPSQMREYLSYTIMREMGVPTPAFSYMYVTINGKEWGLYLGVEAIEETFLARNYADGAGDLYKPDGTGSDLKWISDNIDDYKDINLKTNKGNTDQAALIAMLEAINNGKDIEKYVNVDEMLRYFAVNTALVNLDSYQGDLKHNYYLYEENGVFSILPWDYNMAFGGYPVGRGGAGGGGQPPTEQQEADKQQPAQGKANNRDQNQNNQQRGMGAPGGLGNMGVMNADFLGDDTVNFSITTPVSGTTLADRPLLNALLSNETYKEKFQQYLNEIATKYFSQSYMTNQTSTIANLISSYVEKDPTKFYTTEQFTQSVSGEKSLVQFAVKRAESIQAQLSGKLVVEAFTSSDKGGPPGDGGGRGGNRPAFGGNGNGGQPPPMMNGEANADNMRPPQMGGAPNTGNARISTGTIIMLITTSCLLIGAILFVISFSRRRG
ncbi:CotH kinase family protein [Brevibacillus reuszeri]|uniref:CotH kinase family protein n=1 Tax=Brevibacillus reuszeri TaxID=54915 RepID=UPI002896AEB2|nr:CotH kinase family protein [Brevibacillus reuszeri]